MTQNLSFLIHIDLNVILIFLFILEGDEATKLFSKDIPGYSWSIRPDLECKSHRMWCAAWVLQCSKYQGHTPWCLRASRATPGWLKGNPGIRNQTAP